MCWSALADAVPIHPLYALLFTDHSRRVALVAAGVFQAAGHVL